MSAQIAFTLDIIHIDESAAWGAPAEAAAAARSAVERAVQPYLCEGVRFHSLPLEDVFAAEDPDPEGQRQRLQRLFQVRGGPGELNGAGWLKRRGGGARHWVCWVAREGRVRWAASGGALLGSLLAPANGLAGAPRF